MSDYASSDINMFCKSGSEYNITALQFIKTVSLYVTTKDCFLCLWLKSFCATYALGQPPIKLNQCSVDSGVRQAFLMADVLS